MKRTLLYIGSVFILILSAITFIFVPSMFRDSNGRELPKVGAYDGKAIRYEQDTPYAYAVVNLEAWSKAQGQELNEAAYQSVFSNAFYAAVIYTAATEAVQKSGYEPSTAEVSREMLGHFTDEFGNYSQKVYNATSEANRNLVRKEVVNHQNWNRYYEDVFGTGGYITNFEFLGLTCLRNFQQYVSFPYPTTVGGNSLFGIKTSNAETDFMAQFGSEKRSFDVVSWNKSQYPDEEVIAFGESNADLFKTYELSLLTVSDKAQAEKILKRLHNEEISFADAVKDFSESNYYTESDGVLTMNYAYQVKQIISNEDDFAAVTALPQDALSDVVQTTSGYAIFRRDGMDDGDFVASENVDLVRTYINSYESGLIEEYYLNIAKNFAASTLTASFDRACREYGVEKTSVPAFALNYGNSSLYEGIPTTDAQALYGASTNEYFLEKAFSLTVGEVSEPIVLGTNIVILKLTGEQTDDVTEEHRAAVVDSVAEIDQQTILSNLVYSDKIENNFGTFYSALTGNN